MHTPSRLTVHNTHLTEIQWLAFLVFRISCPYIHTYNDYGDIGCLFKTKFTCRKFWKIAWIMAHSVFPLCFSNIVQICYNITQLFCNYMQTIMNQNKQRNMPNKTKYNMVGLIVFCTKYVITNTGVANDNFSAVCHV